MDLIKLKELKNLIDNEIQLYSGLKSLFEEKRKILVENKVSQLLEVDERILIRVEEIKSAVNQRQRLTGDEIVTLSQMIEMSEKFDTDLAGHFKSAQVEVNRLIKEVAHEERVVKELLRHGMNLVNKTLNMISNSVSMAGDYDCSGKNVHSDIDRISMVVEEV